MIYYNLPLRTTKSSVASINVHIKKLAERKLKINTENAMRTHSRAKENLIFNIMQLVK